MSSVEFDERQRDAAESSAELIRDIAEANRPILVEQWIQDSPDLSVVIGDELLDDAQFIDAIRKICCAFNPSRRKVFSNNEMVDIMAGSRTIARLVREQVDRVHGPELVDDEEKKMRRDDKLTGNE